MSKFSHKSDRRNVKIFENVPSSIVKTKQDRPADWVVSQDHLSPSFCISCVDEPCRSLTVGERSVVGIDSFSSDPGNSVCPVNAIEWDSVSEAPFIDAEACIGCGLCVSRCPVGAMTLKDQVASVSLPDGRASLSLCSIGPIETFGGRQRLQVDQLPAIDASYPIADDEEAVRITSLLSEQDESVQRLAVRSASVAAGFAVSLSRKGDVHTRMDGSYSTEDGAIGSLEVEFGSESLEAVRASLDDVAVLNSRYDLAPERQTPLVVCAELPRNRQGYWQVVSDINTVFGMKISTASVGSLLLLVWNGKRLSCEILEQLTPSFRSTSIRDQIESVLGRKVQIGVGAAGILEPEK